MPITAKGLDSLCVTLLYAIQERINYTNPGSKEREIEFLQARKVLAALNFLRDGILPETY